MALSASLVSLGTFIAIYGLLALGLNLKFGFTGLLDIGHVAFFLIGAYTAALLVLVPDSAPTQIYATYILGLQWTWPPAIVAAMLVSGLAGMLVALPAIRLREDYLAIAVLGISVIAKRTIQTETWLANGPSSLKGWGKPLNEMFPLPGGADSFDLVLFGVNVVDVTLFAVPSAVLFGVIVFGVWSVLLYATASYLGDRDPDSTRSRLLHGLFAVLTLGFGYAATRRARRPDGPPRTRYVLAGGLVAGVLAAALGFLGDSIGFALPGVGTMGMYSAGVAVFLGLASLQTWALAGVVLANYYGDASARDAKIAVGLALGMILVFVPVIELGEQPVTLPVVGAEVTLATVGFVLTLALAVAYVAGVYRLGERWDDYGTTGSFVSVVGLGAVTLFLVRYFLLTLVGPLKAGNVLAVVNTTVANLLWLVNVEAGVVLNYARFRFLFVVLVVAGAYYVLERSVKSPFGRVLKAVRDDEDVANALGKNTFRFKVQSMIIGSAVAGLAGALFALWFGSLVFTSFRPKITFIALLIVVIGGIANNRGAILGAAIYWGFQKATAELASFFPATVRSKIAALRIALIGALFIVILYYRPQGIWGEEHTRMEEVE